VAAGVLGYSRGVVLKVTDVRDGLALAEIGSLSVALWRAGVTRERFDRQSAALRSVVQAHPGAAGFLCIIEPDAKPPDEELRRASARMIEAHEDRLALVAAVIEGSGFQASVTRSALTAIAMLVPRFRTKVAFFSNVIGAAHWARARIELPEAGVVTAEVEALRARLAR
jgi:hypothetical protein